MVVFEVLVLRVKWFDTCSAKHCSVYHAHGFSVYSNLILMSVSTSSIFLTNCVFLKKKHFILI